MGIFNTTLASNKKSKLMKELILIMENKKGGNLERAYQELFNCISTFPGPLSEVVNAYEFTCEEFMHLSQRLSALGYHWQKTDYIPVSVFCFAKPLDYLLSNREVFNEGSYEQLVEVMYNTTRLL
jgi:hypothetical protein